MTETNRTGVLATDTLLGDVKIVKDPSLPTKPKACRAKSSKSKAKAK